MSKKFTNIPYKCPRCGYSTAKKSNINNHFYQKIKICPASINELDLTDEIKECVLNNRTYNIEKNKLTNQVSKQF